VPIIVIVNSGGDNVNVTDDDTQLTIYLSSGNVTGNVFCNSGTGVCIPSSAITLTGPSADDKTKKLVKAYLCGSSPASNIRNWMLEGAAKGAATGAVGGAITGTIVGTPVGGTAGFFLGGLIGGATTAATGVILGSEASLACSLLGVYK
jgi:FlaG/FlaF family flagellin (archaellin)